MTCKCEEYKAMCVELVERLEWYNEMVEASTVVAGPFHQGSAKLKYLRDNVATGKASLTKAKELTS